MNETLVLKVEGTNYSLETNMSQIDYYSKPESLWCQIWKDEDGKEIPQWVAETHGADAITNAINLLAGALNEPIASRLERTGERIWL